MNHVSSQADRQRLRQQAWQEEAPSFENTSVFAYSSCVFLLDVFSEMLLAGGTILARLPVRYYATPATT